MPGHKKCAFLGCKSSTKDNTKIRFFTFPVKFPEICDTWVANCANEGLVDLTATALASRVVCELHFEETCFASSSPKSRLKNNAVPTIFSIDEPASTTTQRQRAEETMPTTPPSAVVVTASPPLVTPHSDWLRKQYMDTSATPGPSHSLPLDSSSHHRPKKQKVSQKCRSPHKTDTTPQRKQLHVLHKKLASPDTPRKLKLRKRLQKYQRNIRRKSEDARRKERKQLTKEAAFVAVSQHIKSDAFKLLLGMQILHKSNTQWKEEEKQLAIELHYRSPALYQNLIFDKGFALPSRRTISCWLSVMDLMPGISENLLEKLKLKVKTMSDLERHVVVMFDEISINKCLSYNEKRDVIEGFQDFGSFGRSPSVGNHVLMFVVRGLFSKWRMPVAHFVSSGVTEGSILVDIVNSVIKALQQIGLNVRVLVCDQGKNNTKAISLMNVTKEKPLVSIENHKIFVMYDVPHLIKSVRNNLLKDDIYYDGGKASWQHVTDLYNIDVSSSKARSLCKLTNKHIEPNSFDKMKVNLATQVFSNSVKAAMLTAIDTQQLPPEAIHTATFIGQLNDIFDCLNSRLKIDPNPLKSAISNETVQGKAVIARLKSVLPWIQSWKKIVTKKTTRITRPPSFLGLEHTINATLQLWEDLCEEKEISYLLTNRLTQDAIEHEFSICRHKGGFVRNPSALQFRQNLRHRMQVALMIPPSSSNCEVDVVEEIPTLASDKDSDIEEIHDTEEEDEVMSTVSDISTEERLQEDEYLPLPDDDESECDEPAPITVPHLSMEGGGEVHGESTRSTLESCSVQ